MKYLTNIDMSQNELQNAIIQPLSVAPENPKLGQIYSDISGEIPELKWWNGTEWIPLGAVKIPENVPTVVNPSVGISILTGDSLVEIGATPNISYKTSFNPGSYSYGPDTGIIVEKWRVYDNSSATEDSSEPSGTFTDIVLEEGEYKITVEATYSAGSIPVTDQGNPYPNAQIPAGTVSATAKAPLDSIQGYRKYFYGSPVEIFELNSDNIRANLTHSDSPVDGSVTFNLPITKGANQVIVAFPTESGLSLTSVIDTGAFNIEVYDIFSKSVVDVEGANGYEAISYDVYTYTPDMSLSKNTYKVTIS